VRDALVQALPLVIDFLSRVLGVSGIGEKIREIVGRVQATVQRAIDWLISKSADMVRTAGESAGLEGEDDSEPSEAAGE
jgi:hypothetical protein